MVSTRSRRCGVWTPHFQRLLLPKAACPRACQSPDSLNFSICKMRVIPKGPRAIVRLPLFTEMSIVPQASEEQRGYRKAEGPPGNFLKGHTKP